MEVACCVEQGSRRGLTAAETGATADGFCVQIQHEQQLQAFKCCSTEVCSASSGVWVRTSACELVSLETTVSAVFTTPYTRVCPPEPPVRVLRQHFNPPSRQCLSQVHTARHMLLLLLPRLHGQCQPCTCLGRSNVLTSKPREHLLCLVGTHCRAAHASTVCMLPPL